MCNDKHTTDKYDTHRTLHTVFTMCNKFSTKFKHHSPHTKLHHQPFRIFSIFSTSISHFSTEKMQLVSFMSESINCQPLLSRLCPIYDVTQVQLHPTSSIANPSACSALPAAHWAQKTADCDIDEGNNQLTANAQNTVAKSRCHTISTSSVHAPSSLSDMLTTIFPQKAEQKVKNDQIGSLMSVTVVQQW